MKVNFICSNINTDKSVECLNIIEKIKSNNNNDQLFYIIVPDQFSYAAEKLVNGRFAGTGLNGIEVLTFSRMTSKFLKRAKKNYLTDPGKSVLILKALYNCDPERNVYCGCVEKSGFADSVLSMITELKRYMITPGVLYETASGMKDGMLKQKLLSLAEIYSEYEKLNNGRFYDSEDDFLILAETVNKEKLFKDAYVFFDEFSDFLPKHYKIIENIMINAKEVYFSISEGFNNSELAKIPNETKSRIITIAKKYDFDISYIQAVNTLSSPESSEIEFMHNNLFDFYKKGFHPYEEKTNDIELFYGDDTYSEVEYAVRRIKWLIEKEGYRYNDILLVCGNTSEYIHIISALFDEYKIPYFTDNKLSVAEHPIILTLSAIFDIINDNWSYDSVFRYLKSGYIYTKNDEAIEAISLNDIDFLENYVLKYGIRGKKKWLSEEDWNYKKKSIGQSIDADTEADDEKNNERLNNIRRLVTEPIKKFSENIKGRRSVRELTASLFDFLRDINLYDGIKKEIEYFNINGRRNEAEQFTKVWNILLEVMDQLVLTIGDEKCNKEEYKNYLIAALSACSIDIIPSSIDCVTVSEPDEARQKKVKALFIIGAVRGSIPKERTNSGVLSDNDRSEISDRLSGFGLEIGSDSNDLKKAAEFKFYSVLFNATNVISISYPLNDFNGEAQVPAQIINDIQKIFINIKKYDNMFSFPYDEVLFAPKDAFDYLLDNRNNKNDNNVKRLYDWFDTHDEWRDKMRIIKEADNYKVKNTAITPENAKKLYNDKKYSVSRLNEYSQCPFLYFVKNGLRAKPQETWQIQSFDLGTLMHFAVCEYCKAIEKDAVSFDELRKNWIGLTDEKSDEIIDSIMELIKERVFKVVERDMGKVNYLLMRMTKTLKRSAELIRKSLSMGEYTAVEHEKIFNMDLDCGSYDIKLRGAIDRIDLALFPNEKRAGIRIIDYKSGNKNLSVVSIANMLDVQLVVYAAAALDLYENSEMAYADNTMRARITGILYNKLRDDMEESDHTEESIDSMIAREMKLNGLVILDNDEQGDNDENYNIDDLLFMDRSLESSGNSSILPVKLNKDKSVSKYSSVVSSRRFDRVIEYVKRNIINADNEIFSGNISIHPYRGKNLNACTFCDMAEICMFDEERDKTRKLCEDKEEAWEIINKYSE